MEKEVVKRLVKLIRFRNEYEAFEGVFSVLASASDEVRLAWEKGEARCTLLVDLKQVRTEITYTDERGEQVTYLV